MIKPIEVSKTPSTLPVNLVVSGELTQRQLAQLKVMFEAMKLTVRETSEPREAETDIKGEPAMVLAYLRSQNSPVGAKDIAEATGIRQENLRPYLSRLARAGLITRNYVPTRLPNGKVAQMGQYEAVR